MLEATNKGSGYFDVKTSLPPPFFSAVRHGRKKTLSNFDNTERDQKCAERAKRAKTSNILWKKIKSVSQIKQVKNVLWIIWRTLNTIRLITHLLLVIIVLDLLCVRSKHFEMDTPTNKPSPSLSMSWKFQNFCGQILSVKFLGKNSMR